MAPTSATSSRRRCISSGPSRGDAWRRRSSAVALSALDLKLQQLESPEEEPQTLENKSLIHENEDFDRPQDAVFTAFQHMEFPESDEDSESDYAPSADEEQEQSESEGLLSSADSEEELQEPNDDRRWWESSQDKRQWVQQYKQRDAVFRRRFGRGIHTRTIPEAKCRTLPHKKTRHRTYKVVLVVLAIAFFIQLVVVYSASSWAFSMVSWGSTTDAMGERSSERKTIQHIPTPTRIDTKLAATSVQVPEHVRTGLHLCSTLSRKVVKSQHDVTATQHALRACDIAVKFAPRGSREGIEARVLRGDLRSLLLRFDGADEDYQAAWILIEDIVNSGVGPKLSPTLSKQLDLKVLANRWTQLYKAKKFKELRQEAKARVVGDHDYGHAVRELAIEWLQTFKREKPVLEVLTLQRKWTLRRLTYEAVDDENNGGQLKPDVS